MGFYRRHRSGGQGRSEGSRPPGRLILEADDELGQELQLAARARGQAPETLAADLLMRGLEQEAVRAQLEAALGSLTPRERQVVWLAARGWTNRRIGDALVISPETVKTHVAHVLEKLRLRSKVELRMMLSSVGGRGRDGEIGGSTSG